MSLRTKMKVEGYIFFILFVGTVWLANYLITHVGLQFGPGEPHLIPVGFGIMAPSGVLAIGIGFTLRDLVQKRLGVTWSAFGVLIGAFLSSFLSPGLALASGLAFLTSETLDLLVYTPLRRKNLYGAVIASNLVGMIVDSAVFLVLAFGSLEFLAGQVLGKFWMTLLFLPVIAVIDKWDRSRFPKTVPEVSDEIALQMKEQGVK